MRYSVVAICFLSFSVALTGKKKQSRTMWGLQHRKASSLIWHSGDSSSSLFPAPAPTPTPFPVAKGRLVSLTFLHRDIKVNYSLSSRLSSTVVSPWLIWVPKVRLLKQYILCDLCKNAENSSYRHNDCKASSCIISMRLFSLHFEKFLKNQRLWEEEPR